MLGQSLPPVHSVKWREDVDEEEDPGKDADDDGEDTDDDSRHPADSVRAPTPPLEAVRLNKPINADVLCTPVFTKNERRKTSALALVSWNEMNHLGLQVF